jgi:hypothetical protein
MPHGEMENKRKAEIYLQGILKVAEWKVEPSCETMSCDSGSASENEKNSKSPPQSSNIQNNNVHRIETRIASVVTSPLFRGSYIYEGGDFKTVIAGY